MVSAETKLQVVARKERTRTRDVDHSQFLLPFGELPAADTPSRVIPFRAKSAPPFETPARREIPPHETEAHASPTPYDAYPGKFTMVPRAIAEDYGRELGPTRTRIFEAMHHLIHGYKDPPKGNKQDKDKQDKTDKRHRSGQISYGEIADLSGVSVRTVERYVPELIMDGFVKRIYRGHLNKGASVYQLTFKAPMPGRVVGPSGGQVESFPERQGYRQNVGSEAPPTTDKMSAVEAPEQQGTTDRMSAVTTDKLSGKYIEERTKEESRSRSRPPDPAAPAADSADRNPSEAIILAHWPTATPKTLSRCLREFDKLGASRNEVAQARARHGPIEAGNPVLWTQKLCDAILEDRRGRREQQADRASSRSEQPECPDCRGMGFKYVGESSVRPCGCRGRAAGLNTNPP